MGKSPVYENYFVTGSLLSKIPFYSHLWALIRLKKVPLDRVRCQVRPFSEKLGFSGNPVDHFPPYRFFKQYLSNPTTAERDYSDWLYSCLFEMEAWKVEKKDGGWKNGSLVRQVYQCHSEAGIDLTDFTTARRDLVEQAISLRVAHYFSVLESIRDRGFDRSLRPPIMARYDNGLYYLIEGHHRTSMLYALGYENVDLYVRVKE